MYKNDFLKVNVRWLMTLLEPSIKAPSIEASFISEKKWESRDGHFDQINIKKG